VRMREVVLPSMETELSTGTVWLYRHKYAMLRFHTTGKDLSHAGFPLLRIYTTSPCKSAALSPHYENLDGGSFHARLSHPNTQLNLRHNLLHIFHRGLALGTLARTSSLTTTTQDQCFPLKAGKSGIHRLRMGRMWQICRSARRCSFFVRGIYPGVLASRHSIQ
jgi:hypothetical protein